jgi:hypothetical protein
MHSGRKTHWWLALLLAVVTGISAPAFAKKVKYVPPDGFAGHKWGALRSTFDRLPEQPVGVGAGWTRPVEKDVTWHCVPTTFPSPSGGVTEGCDFQQTLLTLRRNFEGGGFYVLSEYAIPDQGFRFGDEKDGVTIHPVVYQFCANWDSTKKVVPPNFDSMNKFCGMRLHFQSETLEQLRKLPADHVTVYDRLLERLLAKYGHPDRFVRRGQVVIEAEDGDSRAPGDRKFSTWRWCPARDRAFHTECEASVTLTIDPRTGVGTVLYATPRLWEYAYARETNGFEGDKLYRALHANARRRITF